MIRVSADFQKLPFDNGALPGLKVYLVALLLMGKRACYGLASFSVVLFALQCFGFSQGTDLELESRVGKLLVVPILMLEAARRPQLLRHKYLLYYLYLLIIPTLVDAAQFFGSFTLYYRTSLVVGYLGSVLVSLMMIEIFSLLFDRFPAIKSAARKTIVVFMCISIGTSSLFTALAFPPTSKLHSAISWLVGSVLHGTLAFCLFALLILAFVAWCTVPKSKATLRYIQFLLALLSFRMVLFFGLFFLGERALQSLANVEFIALSITLFLIDTSLFWFPGEDNDTVKMNEIDPAEGARLINRLEELNKAFSVWHVRINE